MTELTPRQALTTHEPVAGPAISHPEGGPMGTTQSPLAGGPVRGGPILENARFELRSIVVVKTRDIGYSET